MPILRPPILLSGIMLCWLCLVPGCQPGASQQGAATAGTKQRPGGATNAVENRALLESTGKGDLEGVKAHLTQGVDVNEHPAEGDAAIILAAKNGHLTVVKLLLAHGSADGERALVSAAKNGHLAIVRLLLAHGVQVNSSDASLHQSVALHEAVVAGHADIVRLLLAHGARYDTAGSAFGPDYSLLFDAPSDNLKVVRALLDAGYSADGPVTHVIDGTVKQDDDSYFLKAVHSGNVPLVLLLLRHGVNVNATSIKGESALQWAQRNNRPDLMSLLQKAGAK